MICTKESARYITSDWKKFSTLVKEKKKNRKIAQKKYQSYTECDGANDYTTLTTSILKHQLCHYSFEFSNMLLQFWSVSKHIQNHNFLYSMPSHLEQLHLDCKYDLALHHVPEVTSR